MSIDFAMSLAGVSCIGVAAWLVTGMLISCIPFSSAFIGIVIMITTLGVFLIGNVYQANKHKGN